MSRGGILTPVELEHLMSTARIQTVVCRYRGCIRIGRWFLRRVLRGGVVQEGKYCDEHEQEFGDQNLRRFARVIGKRVETITDEAGEFLGVRA